MESMPDWPPDAEPLKASAALYEPMAVSAGTTPSGKVPIDVYDPAGVEAMKSTYTVAVGPVTTQMQLLVISWDTESRQQLKATVS